MIRTLKAVALAAALSASASIASAVTISPFSSTLLAGESTFGNAVAASYEGFASTTLSFTAGTDMLAAVSATINPYIVSPTGVVSNSIALSYAIDTGTPTALAITKVDVPSLGSIGASGLSILLSAGETLQFFIDGVAGLSGNQVTFAVETTELAPVPVAPAAAFGLTGVLAFAAVRKRKSKKA